MAMYLYLSLLTAFCELVPVLGASIPMVVLLFYAIAIGDLRGFLLVLLVGYIGVALLPEVTIRPILMGRRTLLSPLLMFASFIGGILLLGLSGFLLGPLAVAMAVSWYRLRKEGRAEGTATPGLILSDSPSRKGFIARGPRFYQARVAKPGQRRWI